jgi:membrane protease YdiL (CAAX protease family)
MAQAVVSACAFVIVSLVAARLEGRRVVQRLGLGADRSTGVGLAAAISGMVGLSLACGAATDLLGVRGSSGVMQAIAQELRSPTAARFSAAVFAIGLAPGLAEETLFRGLLQRRLVAAWGRVPGIAGASIAFGLIHGEPVQGTVAVVAGLFLGWTAERLRGIRGAMVAHAVNNALFVALAAVHAAGSPARGILAASAAAGAVVCVASIAVLSSRLALRPVPEPPP